MLDIVGYDILGRDGLRYAWSNQRFINYVESAAFSNRTKGKEENIAGYTTSVSSGCVLHSQGMQCVFCRTGNMLPFGGFLTYKEIVKQNVFMVLTDMYCSDHPELKCKKREFAYMGQGEPGFSYSQVRLAIEMTNRIMKELNQEVFRHIFATCGVTEAIENYIEDIQGFFTERVTLHYSLHASNRRKSLMPIETVYPHSDVIQSINKIFDISGEKPCIGIMLFNQFTPNGRHYQYTNSLETINAILDHLDSRKCRLSFCEYNGSSDLGFSEEFSKEESKQILELAQKKGFDAKLFSSFGREKLTACGMLGGKMPEHVASSKWKELDCYANDLIKKFS